MTRRRTAPPPIRAGDWVQVTYVVQARRDDELPVAEGVNANPTMVAALGAQIQVFDHRPGPTELKADKAVVARAVDAELALADAQARLNTTTTALEKARQDNSDATRRRERMVTEYRTLARVEHARVRLLTEVVRHNEELRQSGAFRPSPLTLYAGAIADPCPAYDGDVPLSDEDDDEPEGLGAPCVRRHDHEGKHATVDGRRFDAPLLFDYVNPYAEQKGTPA